MLSRILADTVLCIHFLFILFAIFGGLLVLYKKWAAWLHVPTVLWSAIVNLAGWTCPLTPLENFFRECAGEAGYAGGFIQHYIEPLVYPDFMPRKLELIAAFSIVFWNVLIYGCIAYYRRKKLLHR